MSEHLLEIVAKTIPFRSDKKNARACLSLGANWRHRPINLTVDLLLEDQTEKHIECRLDTNCHGNFAFKIGQSVVSLTVLVELKFKTSLVSVRQSFACYESEKLIWRSYEGMANNMENPSWGSVGQMLLEKSNPSRAPRTVNPRRVSNAVCSQSSSRPNSLGLKNLVWAFGQFVDHELDITPDNSGEFDNIITPDDDPLEQFPNRTIKFQRSGYVLDEQGRRHHPNMISAYVDATNVYGSTVERALALRALDGTGRLKTVAGPDGELMPDNSVGLANANPVGLPKEKQFLAGDVRANENLLLIAFHTLFVREHNRLCDEIVQSHPEWQGQDELIYQKARSMVSGLIQNIIYDEFLVALLGQKLADDGSYDSQVNPDIAKEFSTVGYRIGHTMVSSDLMLSDSTSVSLRETFFSPDYVRQNGISQLLWGASQQVMEEIDGKVVDDLRSFLFGPPSAQNLLDLASLNIQRGRDQNVADYNSVRVAYGLAPKTSFAQITNDQATVDALATVYESVDQIDPWIGALVETHLPSAAVGELVATILTEQFTRLRKGDRFWFERDPMLDQNEIEAIKATRLADIIARNTSIPRTDLSDQVFL